MSIDNRCNECYEAGHACDQNCELNQYAAMDKRDLVGTSRNHVEIDQEYVNKPNSKPNHYL